MTKESYENYDKLYTYCCSCQQSLPTKMFSYRNIKSEGAFSVCRGCDWFRRNEVPSVDGFSQSEIVKAIKYIVNEESQYINDLAETLNMSLDDCLKLWKALKIGNKHFVVKTNCACCGEEMNVVPSKYLKNHHIYCSTECYWKDKPNTVGRGKDNCCYNRITTYCTFCNKQIEVTPFKYNIQNSFGEKHNFCSHECYSQYRSIYYRGDKAGAKNRIITEEQREKMRKIVAQNCKSSKRFDSKIQLSINKILEANNIEYEREYAVQWFRIDNFLPKSNLMIEVMGDYWHSSPLKYNKNKYLLNEMQTRGLQHDKQKHTYIKTHLGIEILYLWEKDIEKNPELCERLILKYIKQNGVIENYHSFNWYIKNNQIYLADNIIKPYQDMRASEYADLIKEKSS